MRTLSDTLRRGDNNFDLIRLIAAFSVMFGHSYGTQPAKHQWEPVFVYTYGESSGSFAVFAFLILSGMLVTASYERQRSTLRFVALRLVRIWPAFAVCAVLITFFIGPAVSNVQFKDYMVDPLTRAWFIHAITLVDGTQHYLPGVFENNPIKRVVNGPMWSLPLELKCYLVVLAAGITGAIGSKRGMVLIVAVAYAGFSYLVAHPPDNLALQDIILLPPVYLMRPFQFFLLGMLFYAFREHIVINGKIAFALVMAYLLLRWVGQWVPERLQLWGGFRHSPILYVAFVYGLLWIAASETLHRIKLPNDYSYGIYLYGFVVQQIISSHLSTLNNFVSLLIAVPITILIAAASWHIVEKPCLVYFRNKFAPRVPIQSGSVAG